MRKHVVPIFGREVGPMKSNTERVSDLLCVFEIGFSGAILGAVVLLPVLHEEAFDRKPRLLQAQRGD